MKGTAKAFFILAIAYAVLGMVLGIIMAASHDHGQMPTHAHIMVAGWVTSSVFAFFYHLFPSVGNSRLANIHFWVQAVSGAVLVASLYVLLNGTEAVEPVTALASIGFLAGMILFIWNALPVLKPA